MKTINEILIPFERMQRKFNILNITLLRCPYNVIIFYILVHGSNMSIRENGLKEGYNKRIKGARLQYHFYSLV